MSDDLKTFQQLPTALRRIGLRHGRTKRENKTASSCYRHRETSFLSFDGRSAAPAFTDARQDHDGQ
ncbi:hypothetical protein [Kushneria aurantia]|uniref:Uncharacterized protein n=1 Tax=Kushneria aurantia TaxID=504092 RepID=A0ABV6G250_9GAMM|nr:hypothetical protein [Kushneria aurantia]